MQKLYFSSAKTFWPMAGIWFGVITGVLMIAIGMYDRAWYFVAFGILTASWNVWTLRNTRYEIADGKLKFLVGFDKKIIEINSIRTITKNASMRALERAALASGGLLVQYNTYDELYISPRHHDGFIEAILKINPAVEVREAYEVKEAFNFNKY